MDVPTSSGRRLCVDAVGAVDVSSRTPLRSSVPVSTPRKEPAAEATFDVGVVVGASLEEHLVAARPRTEVRATTEIEARGEAEEIVDLRRARMASTVPTFRRRRSLRVFTRAT
jgi:hypothetical protein